VGGVLDEALRVRPCFIELAHVAQDTDCADDLARRVAQGRGVQGRRNDLAASCARIQAYVPANTAAVCLSDSETVGVLLAFNHFSQGGEELPRLFWGNDAGERLLH